MITTQSIPPVEEYENFTRTIAYTLQSNQTLVSYTINVQDAPETILIQGQNISGRFVDIFSLGPQALKYRMKNDHSLGSVGRFDDLPEKNSCILYEFNPPRVIKRDYNVTATLVYDETTQSDPDSGSTTGIKTRKTDTKSYVFTVYGNYDKFSKRLRDYVL